MTKRMGFESNQPKLPEAGEREELTLKQWVKSAPVQDAQPEAAPAEPPPKPWKDLPKHAPTNINFNLRLNAYERERLAFVAGLANRSMQAEAKRLLFAAVDKLCHGSSLHPKRIHRRAKQEPKKETG